MRKTVKGNVVEKEPIEDLETKTEDVKKADTVIKDIPIANPDAPGVVNLDVKYLNPPPQGSVTHFITRTKEAGVLLDEPMKKMLLNPDGTPLPEWVQVARMFNRPYKKVAIVGFADTRNEAPYTDPSWEIWGLNDLHSSIPRYDRWFDIHTRENIDEDVRLGRTPPGSKCGLDGLRGINVPIYMQDRYEDVPNSIKFPLKEIVDRFGNYFTNSISYMTALAIFEDYKEIAIYGVDMAVGSEYVDQRPSCEYFIGLARGAGIKVYIPPASDLCKTRFMYAFEEVRQHQYTEKIQNMVKNMQSRQQSIAQQMEQMKMSHAQYEGAIGATREIQKIWANLDDKL